MCVGQRYESAWGDIIDSRGRRKTHEAVPGAGEPSWDRNGPYPLTAWGQLRNGEVATGQKCCQLPIGVCPQDSSEIPTSGTKPQVLRELSSLLCAECLSPTAMKTVTDLASAWPRSSRTAPHEPVFHEQLAPNSHPLNAYCLPRPMLGTGNH